MERHRSGLTCSLVTLLLLQGTLVDSYKILMVFPSFSKSHLIIASSATKGLAEEGHQVTVVSSFPQKETIPNYRDVFLPIPEVVKNLVAQSVASDKANHSPKSLYNMFVETMRYCNSSMGHPEVQRMMREESFDLVITSPICGQMVSGLANHFKAPLVQIMPLRAPLLTALNLGNPAQLASVPSMVSALRNPMSFKDRLRNLISSGVEIMLFTVMDLMEWYYYNSNFPSPAYPSYHEAKSNVSLLLTAYHFSQGPVANVPQIVDIGGIQMDSKLVPLPEHLQTYLDAAVDGVIFFSFGTNVLLKKLDQEKVKNIFAALGKTQMKVLLKYDTDEEIEGLPENILSASWLPQREVLAHPNVKLFVSHGGLGSIMEAKYYGVPVLGMPVFGDQPGNVAMAVQEKWAVQVDLSTLTEQSMTEGLEKVLGDITYSTTVKRLSNVYRDRPLGPMKTAIYWVEYVIRHQGAPHMRSPAADLNFLQKNSIDVMVVLAVVIYLFVVIVKYLVKGCNCMVRKVLKKKVVSAKKRN